MGREAICLGSSLREGFLDTVCGLPENNMAFSVWISSLQPVGQCKLVCALFVFLPP